METALTRIIDQYLSGELSSDDRRIFEDRMESNEQFRQEVETQRTIQEVAKRAAQRGEIKKIRKSYHLKRLLKWSSIGLSGIALLFTAGYLISNTSSEPLKVDEALIDELNDLAQIDDLPTQYFAIPEEGALVMSEEGVLISVPEGAFLLNGKVYKGSTVVQFQEAMKANSIVKAGLSTMSGDKMLETQGMFGVAGFTEDGQALEFNPKVGVYVQVPVDQYKDGMQLFSGVKDAQGNIDWQNPVPLAKIPVPVDMSELDFYPEDYEPYLNSIQWKTDKQSRDSLYLSFDCPDNEPVTINAVGIVPSRRITAEENNYLYAGEPRAIDKMMTVEEALGLSEWTEGPNWNREFSSFGRDTIDLGVFDCCNSDMPVYVQPSHVLAFWNKKFNKTNLATREFEQRMRAIHGTCNNEILKKYTSQLRKSLSDIDRQVIAMGYPEFERFAAENLAPLNPQNAHIDHLEKFYQTGIDKLRYRADKLRDKEQNRQRDWDHETDKQRDKERTRTAQRETDVLMEEFDFNMKHVKRQIGNSVGFTLNHGGGTIVNIDKYVWDATVSRTSTTITDPFTGKTAEIVYNDFSFEVENADKYIKLFAYVFPHELNSYHRLEGKKGKFSFPLNNAILYDVAVVGVKENGYDYFQKQSFRQGELGEINLEHISEDKMEASIEQLNRKRNNTPVRFSDEVKWLTRERADYKEQELRKQMAEFRSNVGSSLFPCMAVETVFGDDQGGQGQ